MDLHRVEIHICPCQRAVARESLPLSRGRSLPGEESGSPCATGAVEDIATIDVAHAAGNEKGLGSVEGPELARGIPPYVLVAEKFDCGKTIGCRGAKRGLVAGTGSNQVMALDPLVVPAVHEVAIGRRSGQTIEAGGGVIPSMQAGIRGVGVAIPQGDSLPGEQG